MAVSNNNIQSLKSDIGNKVLTSFLKHIKTNKSLKEVAKLVQIETNCMPKEFWNIIRIALSGESHGPALDMIIQIYGFKKVKSRIDDALTL